MRNLVLSTFAAVVLCACSDGGGGTSGPGGGGSGGGDGGSGGGAGNSGVPAEVVLRGTDGDRTGASVAAGDIDGDGARDLVIGAPGDGFGAPGRAYVVHGPLAEPLIELPSAPGFAIVGEHDGHYAGAEVEVVGDVDGDGLDDVLVAGEEICKVPPGCVEDCPVECSTGPFRSYLVYGTTAAAEVKLADVADGLGGTVIEGESPDDLVEQVFAPLGDLNGDGLADFAVSAPFAKGLLGRVYVVFGAAAPGPIQLADVAAGQGGYVIDPEAPTYGTFGRSIAAAGDVNGDGIGDLVIGDTAADENRGRAYIVFGKATGEPVTTAEVVAGTRGFAVQAENNILTECCSETGLEVAGGGDFNGDGLADVVITAPYLELGGGPPAGRVYTIFGKAGGDIVVLADVAKGLGGGAALDGINGTGHTLGRALLDFQADGLADYLVEDDGDVHLVRGRTGMDPAALGDTGVSERVLPQTAGAWYLGNGSSIGDLDGDGTADFALVNAAYEQAAAGQVLVIHR
jgi:hypothetical protein